MGPINGAVCRAVVVAALSVWAADAGAKTIRIAAFGDSNTAAFMVGAEKGYPADLQKLLRAKGYDVVVADGGVSGAKSADGVQTVDKLVPPGSDIAIVFFGRNDKRWGVAEAVTHANMDKIVARLTQRGVAVLLCGYWAYDFSDIARAHDAAYYRSSSTAWRSTGRSCRNTSCGSIRWSTSTRMATRWSRNASSPRWRRS